MFKPNFCEDDNRTIILKYKINQPIKLNIKRKDGLIILTGFGIGDIISIACPRMQYCSCSYIPWTEIPLEDGSILLDPKNELNCLERIYD